MQKDYSNFKVQFWKNLFKSTRRTMESPLRTNLIIQLNGTVLLTFTTEGGRNLENGAF